VPAHIRGEFMQKRKILRLQNYDYSNQGYYFVTICTKDSLDYFGRIDNKQMILNDAGKMIERIWHEMPQKYPGINIDAFIIMPNHIHGIILIGPAQGRPVHYRISCGNLNHIRRRYSVIIIPMALISKANYGIDLFMIGLFAKMIH
jgi:hypothetical protein